MFSICGAYVPRDSWIARFTALVAAFSSERSLLKLALEDRLVPTHDKSATTITLTATRKTSARTRMAPASSDSPV
jgi:hypothetical protein